MKWYIFFFLFSLKSYSSLNCLEDSKLMKSINLPFSIVNGKVKSKLGFSMSFDKKKSINGKYTFTKNDDNDLETSLIKKDGRFYIYHKYYRYSEIMLSDYSNQVLFVLENVNNNCTITKSLNVLESGKNISIFLDYDLYLCSRVSEMFKSGFDKKNISSNKLNKIKKVLNSVSIIDNELEFFLKLVSKIDFEKSIPLKYSIDLETNKKEIVEKLMLAKSDCDKLYYFSKVKNNYSELLNDEYLVPERKKNNASSKK